MPGYLPQAVNFPAVKVNEAGVKLFPNLRSVQWRP